MRRAQVITKGRQLFGRRQRHLDARTVVIGEKQKVCGVEIFSTDKAGRAAKVIRVLHGER